MQTTLLSIGIALILALLAALLGPHVVRWNDHRAFFEAEASRILGLKVRVGGDIDAALLPVPSVTLRAIAIGPPGEDSRLRARSLRIELALGSLMRGELRATEMKLVAPQVNIGLDPQGRIDWPPLALAKETLSIDRLTIEDARATLADAGSNARVVLDKLWFQGEVRSLTGPIRGAGTFIRDGKSYSYDVSVGRQGTEGVRLKIGLRTDDHPLTIESEGMLAFDSGVPHFDGSLALSRPAGAVLPDGRTTTNQPWRLTSKVKAGHTSAMLDDVSFRYGPDEQAVTLTGSAEFTFGRRPQLEGSLAARQIDVDRLLATPQTPRRVPLAALQGLGDLLGNALRPSWPVRLALSIDAMTLGGASVQNIVSNVRSDGSVWTLDKLEFRAPGFTRISVDGRLYPLDKALGFAGGVSLDSNDPKTLLAWLSGKANATAQFRPWHLKGDVTLGSDRIAVERLRTQFDRGTVEGSLSYVWPSGQRAARLEGKLRAPELDVDGALAFGASALSGLGLERPGEIALALDIGHARIAGLDAHGVAARLSLNGSGLAIERLAADLGDVSFAATGRIETSSPGGSISVDLDARDLGGLVALAERFTPALAEPLRRLSARQKTAALRANVSLTGDANRTVGKVELDGKVGAIRVRLAANAAGKREAFSAADLGALADTEMRLDGQFESDHSGPLLALIGLDRLSPADDDKRAGRLELSAHGPLSRELRFDAKLDAGPVDAAGVGTLKLPRDRPATLDLDKFSGSIGGSPVTGRLALRFGDMPQLEGSIETESLDGPTVAAAVLGLPSQRGATSDAGWSTDPIAWVGPKFSGRVDFKAQRASLTPWLIAENLRGVARFNGSEVAFENVAGEIAHGQFEARLALSKDAGGLATRLRVGLENADLSALLPAGDAAPFAGQVALQAEVEGSGRSPAAFMGSLSGFGSVRLEKARLTGLNPDVFGAVIRAVELGIPIEGPRIREFVKGVLDNAGLPVTHASAAISIAAGQARLRDFSIRSEDAELDATASLNLSDATLDALLTLKGPSHDGTRPAVLVSLNGPLPAPRRGIDTNLLTSWLTLRAIEQRAKQLRLMEQAAREAAAAAAAAAAAQPKPEGSTGEQPPAPDTTAATPPANAAKKTPAASPPPIIITPPRIAPRAENPPPPAAKPQPGLIGAQN